jgi:hypothetical protein
MRKENKNLIPLKIELDKIDILNCIVCVDATYKALKNMAQTADEFITVDTLYLLREKLSKEVLMNEN